MSNMSYCRWENTSNDLQDCFNSLCDVHNLKVWFEELSESEQMGFRNIMALAKDFVNEVQPDIESHGVDI